MNQGTDGGDQNRNHGGFVHTGCAGTHICQEIGGGCCAGRQHNDRTGGDANQKNHKYIDTDDAAGQNQQVGNELDQMVFHDRVALDVGACTFDKENHQGDQCGGNGNPEIGPELILHGTSLSVAGGNGGV